MKIGFIGPKGTYSEIITKKYFKKESNNFTSYPLITDIAKSVENNKIDCGIIPIESLRNGTMTSSSP
ncbi:MAG: prephenate dehydratase domain-containing protein [archaeon]